MTEAYPLKWPEHKKRVAYRESSRFKVGFAKARDELMKELRALGARYIVLSTNIPLKQDGMPYASFKTPDDPGAAVYFQYKEKPMCFACDRWRKIEDNIQAIRHTIAALRGIARWGTGDMLQAAFDGFQALPPPGAVAKQPWYVVLGVLQSASTEEIKAAYRDRARAFHPDHGGTHEQMSEINEAYQKAILERNAA